MTTKHLLAQNRWLFSLIGAVIIGLLLTVFALRPVQVMATAGQDLADPPSRPNNSPAPILTTTNTITTSPEILNWYKTTAQAALWRPTAAPTVANSTQALTCNPSGGNSGLTPGTYDTTIAGQPASIIVGQGYDPAQPTYLAFYLHGDEGGYTFNDHPSNPVHQFIDTHSWVYVAPQAPKANDGDYYPWDGRGGGDIEGNAQLVRDVLNYMFTNYNVCRNILFGGSVSGGSWFYDIYFYPQNGGQYPSFINLVCGAGGVRSNPDYFGSYANLVTLSGNPDIVARTEHKYTIGTDDFLYDNAVLSVASYSGLGFSVLTEFPTGVAHCLSGAAVSPFQSIRDYWQAKLSSLSTITFDKAVQTSGIISPSAEVTYSLTIFNDSSQATTDLTVSDTFPAQLSYVADSAAATPPTIDLTGFPTATLPFTLSANTGVTITYRLRVADSGVSGMILINTAALSAPTFAAPITDAVPIGVGFNQNNNIFLPLVIKTQ